jgi:hypothetical protein
MDEGLLVFPAASSPSIRIRISRLANSLLIILLSEPPMLHNSLDSRRVGDVMMVLLGLEIVAGAKKGKSTCGKLEESRKLHY